MNGTLESVTADVSTARLSTAGSDTASSETTCSDAVSQAKKNPSTVGLTLRIKLSAVNAGAVHRRNVGLDTAGSGTEALAMVGPGTVYSGTVGSGTVG